MPGIDCVSSLMIDEMPPSPPESSDAPSSSPIAASSSTSTEASISMQNKFETPATATGSRPNFWPNASLKLCAGSVLTTSAFAPLPSSSRRLAIRSARQHEVVVLPTPPFPPTKIHLRERCPTMFTSEPSGSGSSSSSPSAMPRIFTCAGGGAAANLRCLAETRKRRSRPRGNCIITSRGWFTIVPGYNCTDRRPLPR